MNILIQAKTIKEKNPSSSTKPQGIYQASPNQRITLVSPLCSPNNKQALSPQTTKFNDGDFVFTAKDEILEHHTTRYLSVK